ncbi:MAG: hypothetical protein ACI3XP_06830 [Eubacteriales bacterium]
MADIIKVYKEQLPALRFIFREYRNFGHWGEWFQNGWFDRIEEAMGGTDAVRRLWQDGGGYCGMECRTAQGRFSYRIGMFTPPETPAPEGFSYMDFAPAQLGVLWIRGGEREVHSVTAGYREALARQGLEPFVFPGGEIITFENCTCPRYTTPDADGNIILDYCCFVQ